MNFMNRPQRILFFIIVLNVVSTWLHYTDNALFINKYTGLDWFTPIGIFGTVTVMTPIGLLGYWLYAKDFFQTAYLCLCTYAITSISSPGHYLLPGAARMTLKMHSLIWLDGISGLLIVGFVLWSGLVAKEWHMRTRSR